MLAEKVCDLGLDRLGEKGTCPVAQDFCELIVEDSWLNQMDDVIVGHGISLLRWRSGGVKHPHDMPPSRFPPSPTLGDSSTSWQAATDEQILMRRVESLITSSVLNDVSRSESELLLLNTLTPILTRPILKRRSLPGGKRATEF